MPESAHPRLRIAAALVIGLALCAVTGLGGAVALLRDMLNPDDLVVGGQAFTEYPEGLRHVESAFAERSILPARDLRVTTFGNRVQEAGAGIVSLGGLYANPINALRRTQVGGPAAAV